MKKLFILISLLLMLVFSGCITKERCARFYPPEITRIDTIRTVIKELQTDTLITVKPDSSMIRQLLECDKNGQITLKEFEDYKAGTIARIPSFTIKGNMLTIDCKCDSAKIHAILKNRETVITEKKSITIIPPPVQVKFIPGWMWFFGITGMIAWVAVVILLLIHLLKNKLKLFI